MAKTTDCGMKFRLIHLVLVLLGVFGSGIAAWVWQQAESKAIVRETVALKSDGCKPARKNTTDIAVIQSQLTDIKTEQKEMRQESKEGFAEILKRLK